MTKSTDIFGETDRLRAEVERLQRIIEDQKRRLDSADGRRADPLPWDAGSNRHYEPVEQAAKQIYEAFAYDGPGQKPAWMPGGNSTKQDEARSRARELLRRDGHTDNRT